VARLARVRRLGTMPWLTAIRAAVIRCHREMLGATVTVPSEGETF